MLLRRLTSQRQNAAPLLGGDALRCSRAGQVRRAPPPPWAADEPDAPPEQVELPPEQVERIEREVERQVEDPELRGSILRARLAQLGRALRFKLKVD